MSFCFLYNVVSENHSVQNSPWGEGRLLPAHGLYYLELIFRSSDYLLSELHEILFKYDDCTTSLYIV